MKHECPFCSKSTTDFLLENKYAFAIYDGFPVSKGHILIISKRHTESFFDLSSEEQEACLTLLNAAKRILDHELNPDGYNVGINVHESAGQTVWHVHIHLIPRYKGDIENPRGGVRGVIPSKRNY